MEFSQQLDAQQIQSDKMALYTTSDVELLQNFTKETPSGYVDLASDIEEMIKQLVLKGFLLVLITGPSGAGKSALGNNLFRVLKRSSRLHLGLSRAGYKELDILTVPISLIIQATQRCQVPEQFKIDDKTNNASFSLETSRKFSAYQYYLIDQEGLSRRKFNLQCLDRGQRPIYATAIIGECATPLVYPKYEMAPDQPGDDLELAGVMDLVSAFYRLALNPEVRDLSWFYFVEPPSSDKVKELAATFRQQVNAETFSPLTFKGHERLIIPKPNDGEILVNRISLENQLKVNEFKRILMATPEAMANMSSMLNALMVGLAEAGDIPDATFRSYAKMIASRLGILNHPHTAVVNSGDPFLESIGEDLGYYTNSVPIRYHPELLSPLDMLRRRVRQPQYPLIAASLL